MLSTPPAFILSQDQTLRSKAASPPPTDHVSVILFLKLSVGAPRPLTGKKVELALSNVRLTSEKTYCPSLEFHPQYPVVKVPREASRPAALASGARKYFTGTRIPRQAVHEIPTTSLSRSTGRPDRRGRRLPHFRKGSSHMIQLPGFRARGFLKNLSSARMAPETAENPSQYVMRRLV